jgi:hypothetical protein
MNSLKNKGVGDLPFPSPMWPWPSFQQKATRLRRDFPGFRGILGGVVAALLTGCADLPTMQYCDKVKYERTGNLIVIEAECRAPVGMGAPGLPGL